MTLPACAAFPHESEALDHARTPEIDVSTNAITRLEWYLSSLSPIRSPFAATECLWLASWSYTLPPETYVRIISVCSFSFGAEVN